MAPQMIGRFKSLKGELESLSIVELHPHTIRNANKLVIFLEQLNMMNRRQAIQQLSIMGVGLALYPACQVEDVPHYARVPLDKKKYKLFREISEAILPVDHIIYVTPETRSEFILTILNDCTEKESVDSYLSGLESLQNYLDKSKQSNLDKLSNEELDEIFSYMSESEANDQNLFSFYQTTKNLAQQHFTGSEKFMKEELKYEFIPGRYIGCADV